MVFRETALNADVEILAAAHYHAVPYAIVGSGVVKAGMPIKKDGSTSATGTDAFGVLLYDVDPSKNPNGAVIVDGVVDWDKCKAHSGATATAAAMAAIIPDITFVTASAVSS